MANSNEYINGIIDTMGNNLELVDAQARSDIERIDASLTNLIYTKSFPFDEGSIGANSYKRVSKNVSVANYTPLGIIEINNTGTGDAWIQIAEYYIENGVAYITFANQTTATNYTLAGNFIVLYVHS